MAGKEGFGGFSATNIPVFILIKLKILNPVLNTKTLAPVLGGCSVLNVSTTIFCAFQQRFGGEF